MLINPVNIIIICSEHLMNQDQQINQSERLSASMVLRLMYFIIFFFIIKLLLLLYAMFCYEEAKEIVDNICDNSIRGFIVFYMLCDLSSIMCAISTLKKMQTLKNITRGLLLDQALIHLIMYIVSISGLSIGCGKQWTTESTQDPFVLNSKIYLLIQFAISQIVPMIVFLIVILNCCEISFSVCCEKICRKNNNSPLIEGFNNL